MFQDKMVLCASSAYEKKFYLNENFEGLPQHKVFFLGEDIEDDNGD